ncbi:hypothetical protein NF701_02520 [Sphingomonadaceae bacterium OTU29THOMA1]|nr:hypothetical protein NF701_02520 [Sphingomonadaceae bacterium OTU29THOMA1]
MSQTTPVMRYRPTEARPYAVELHLDGCSCTECSPPLPLARLTIAGIIVGNAIAFAWDAHGAWQALRATVGL